VICGPNGAGKSTVAPSLLHGPLKVEEFVNADEIAVELSSEGKPASPVTAGREMLRRMALLSEARTSFAFETTLGSRSFAPWLRSLREGGYRVHLAFLFLPTTGLAIRRVAARVRLGGHDIPEKDILRRYDRGLRNFFDLYQLVAHTWRVYDSSKPGSPRLIAWGSGCEIDKVEDESLWQAVRRASGRE